MLACASLRCVPCLCSPIAQVATRGKSAPVSLGRCHGGCEDMASPWVLIHPCPCTTLTRHSAPPPPSVFHQGSIRDWRVIHSGVMGSEPVDPRGVATETDPAVYGVCHSDINSSNYFFNAAGDDGESPFICAFDWDQVCAEKEKGVKGGGVAGQGREVFAR